MTSAADRHQGGSTDRATLLELRAIRRLLQEIVEELKKQTAQGGA